MKSFSLAKWPANEWLLMVCAAPLLLFPGKWSAAGFLLVAAAWLVRRRATGAWRLATPADPGVALFLLTALIGIITSVDRALSLNRAVVLFYGWFLYESTVTSIGLLGVHRRLWVLAGLIGAGFAMVSLAATDWSVGILVPIQGVYEFLPKIDFGIPGSGVPSSGGLLNPRIVASFVILIWPINALLAFTKLPIWQRLFHALTVITLLAILFLTQSPHGVLAAGVSLLILLFTLTGKWGRVGLLAILIMGMVIGLILLILFSPGVDKILNSRAGFGLVARLEIWVRAWRMFISAPLTGIGLNNYPSVMDKFYPGYLLGPEPHAHNLFLQTLTDQGIFGLCGLLLMICVVLWAVVRVEQNSSDKLISSIMISIAAAIAGWLAFGIFEVPTLGHKAGFLLWILFAIPVAIGKNKDIFCGQQRLWMGVASFVILTTVILWQVGALRYNIATVSAQKAILNPTTQIQNYSRASHRLALAENSIGSTPHLLRLRALLEEKWMHPETAVQAFRQLAAAESLEPLWWWAPAAVFSGELPSNIASEPEHAAGLAAVYHQWYIRFPDRVEPVLLLAYTYADAMGNNSRGIGLINQHLAAGSPDPLVLQEALKDLTGP